MRFTPRLLLSFSLALCFSIQYSSPQAKPLREIAHELETVHISKADFPPYEVPEAARPLLLAWKIGIREGIAKALSDPANSSLSVDHLKYAIQEQLKKEEGLRPLTEPDKPNVRFSAKSGLYRCAEQPFRLRADANEFSVSYIDRMNFDFDLFAKVAVDRFAIRGGEIRRIPPMRQDAVDFVDHWIGLPEHDAAILVSAGGRDRALHWHRKLARLRTLKGSESRETS